MPFNPTLDDIRKDLFVLDSEEFQVPEGIRLLSHENLTDSLSVSDLSVEYIPPNRWTNLFCGFRFLFHFFYALQLLRAGDRNSVLIINGSGPLWLFVAYLKKWFYGHKRSLFLWFVYLEFQLGTEKRFWFFPFLKFKTSWKEAIARAALAEYGLIPVWSRKQVLSHAKYYRLPEEKFIFLPYKSNHSKRPSYHIPIGNFIFSGGNNKRDYLCLVEAVQGTDIPVVISTTLPSLRQQIPKHSNIIVLSATEPAFAQLQAASRFVVLPTTHSGLRGTAEANFCNAMWHSKPVIASCSMGAEDYIVEGETGYVVPAGDHEGLRKRILELWNDPERCQEMGKKARAYAEKNFTHKMFIRRVLRLAFVLGQRESTKNSEARR